MKYERRGKEVHVEVGRFAVTAEDMPSFLVALAMAALLLFCVLSLIF